ncbi:MAG: permease-like cell division protein FtsX [Candidatus Shapirobacteria bacterium]|jgi:cell division transport system permease protein
MSPLKTAWLHLRRSPFQGLTALLMMTIFFFLSSSFVFISYGFSSLLNYYETKPEITIFLKDGIDSSTIDSIQKEISNFEKIREIRFISKEKALSIYQEQNRQDPLLTELVTSSILPASFEVSVSDPKVLEQISSAFSGRTNIVDEIIYQKDTIDSLLNWTNIIRHLGLVAISIFGFTSFLVIFVIIGMKITSRKEEIKICRLLGASSFYVVRPFLLEGVIYGFIGALVGSGISFAFSEIYRQSINQFFQPIVFIPVLSYFQPIITLSCLFFGIFLGSVAGWFGSKRYIRF